MKRLCVHMARLGYFLFLSLLVVSTPSIAQPTPEKLARIGFHVGPDGNQTGLTAHMSTLDSAGIPFFLKSVDAATQILEAVRLREVSGVPHQLVYRRSTGSGGNWDVPDYNLPPKQAAEVHWNRFREEFPPELEDYKHWIWVEIISEVDKNLSEWLAEFSYEAALMAMNDGFNLAAFGWSSGEPEPEHWEGPQMLNFLRLAADHPGRLAVALHEYSGAVSSIDRRYPHLVGRFQALFAAAEGRGLERPTVLITEWGWTDEDVPGVDQAMQHVRWADELYESYPQVRGAAIWHLGAGFGGIGNEAQALIEPITNYYLQKYGTGGATTGSANVTRADRRTMFEERNAARKQAFELRRDEARKRRRDR